MFKVLFVICSLVVSGCCHLGNIEFEGSNLGMAKNSRVSVFYISSNPATEVDSETSKYLNSLGDSDAKTKIEKSCTNIVSKNEIKDITWNVKVQTFVPIEALPIVTAIGKYLVDSYYDAKIRKLEKLKKAAEISYSANTTIYVSQLANGGCVVLTRFSNDEAKPSLIYAVKLNPVFKQETQEAKSNRLAFPEQFPISASAFKVIPFFVKARNTVAVTSKSKVVDNKNIPAKINTTASITLKAVVPDKLKINRLQIVGMQTVAKPNVILGDNEKGCVIINGITKDFSKCPNSDLLPNPRLDHDEVLSLSMGITETGNVGIDFDQKKSELNALKASLGPALKESLGLLLKEEEE